MLDMPTLAYDACNLPTVSARTLPSNVKSHSIFTQFDFAALPRVQTLTEQVMRVRPPGHPLPLPLDPSIYIPAERVAPYVPALRHARSSLPPRSAEPSHALAARAKSTSAVAKRRCSTRSGLSLGNVVLARTEAPCRVQLADAFSHKVRVRSSSLPSAV